MADRPYTRLSCCISLDGYLGATTGARLILSNDVDLDRVDGVRAASDAILVGAETIRRDDPRLLIRSPERRAARLARGVAATPVKVTLTRSGQLDAGAQFFVAGTGEKVVYCPTAAAPDLRRRLGALATVVEVGPHVELDRVLEDLSGRGVEHLMVEGGGTVLTQFLAGELADQLDLAVAPLLLGDARAPRFVGEGVFPWAGERRATLVDVQPMGDVALMRYALSDRFGAA